MLSHFEHTRSSNNAQQALLDCRWPRGHEPKPITCLSQHHVAFYLGAPIERFSSDDNGYPILKRMISCHYLGAT